MTGKVAGNSLPENGKSDSKRNSSSSILRHLRLKARMLFRRRCSIFQPFSEGKMEYSSENIGNCRLAARLLSKDQKQLLFFCTRNVQVKLNNKTYRQKNCLAIGSTLCPLSVDVFVIELEGCLLESSINIPHPYKHCVDDTFCLFTLLWGLLRR